MRRRGECLRLKWTLESMMNPEQQNALMIDVSICFAKVVYPVIARHEDQIMRKQGKSWEAQLVDDGLRLHREFFAGRGDLEV